MASTNEYYQRRIKRIMISKLNNEKSSVFAISGVVARLFSTVAQILAVAGLFIMVIPSQLIYVLTGIDYVAKYMKWCNKAIFKN